MQIFLCVMLFLAGFTITSLVGHNHELKKELLKTEILLLKEKLNCKAPEAKK